MENLLLIIVLNFIRINIESEESEQNRVIYQKAYHNNIDYYAKIIKIKFNKELERDSMNPDDIINLILDGK